jgi:hypothetical protein
MRNEPLLAWQWDLYPSGHRDRRNLVIHVVTVPVFMGGTLALLAAPIVTPWLALAGAAAMVGAIAIQGRTHRLEATAPVPFRGPLDVALRLLAEQWITFPRYVLTGGFARAWRESGGVRAARV